jgi:hypothetical protein
MTLPEGIPLLLSRAGQQQASLYSPASTQVQQVDRELPPSLLGEAPVLTDIVAKAVYIIYKISRHQEVPTEVYSRILSTFRLGLGRIPATTTLAERPGSI